MIRATTTETSVAPTPTPTPTPVALVLASDEAEVKEICEISAELVALFPLTSTLTTSTTSNTSSTQHHYPHNLYSILGLEPGQAVTEPMVFSALASTAAQLGATHDKSDSGHGHVHGPNHGPNHDHSTSTVSTQADWSGRLQAPVTLGPQQGQVRVLSRAAQALISDSTRRTYNARFREVLLLSSSSSSSAATVGGGGDAGGLRTKRLLREICCSGGSDGSRNGGDDEGAQCWFGAVGEAMRVPAVAAED
ncbi:hypothetical protein GGR56DRAFT_661193 [Xylariaceae sp. FL0804]|nr:hypothetical protein GGR56DRAFT_661193 [Xylariaceae sp. FL0804]